MTSVRCNLLPFGACLLLLLAPHAPAQNAAWVNPSGGFYEESSNWVPSVVPGASNDVLINVGTDYNIGFLSDHSANSLSISNNLDLTFTTGGPGDVEQTFSIAGDATIDRATLTLGDLTQGRPLHLDIDGQLNMTGANLGVLNGAHLDTLPSLASSNTIEGAGGTASQVLVSGTDVAGQVSRWASGGDINIGRSGNAASLTVDQGAQVSSDGGVTIGSAIGANGSLLSVQGTSADGTRSSVTSGFFQLGFVSGGGGISSATALVRAGGRVSTGNVQVFKDSQVLIEREDLDRNPSRWDAELLDVFGGFVEIFNGGHLTSDSARLDRLAIAKVNGVGAGGQPSRWDVNGNIRLGSNDGFGTILIDSGLVTSDSAEIGVGAGSNLLSLDGIQNAPATWENSGDAYFGGSSIGPEASGDFRINDEHSRADIGGTLTIWGPGTVRINGGEMKVDVVDHTHGGAFEFNAGTLSVNRFDGNLLNPAGTLAPGVDAETSSTLINGDYTQQSGGTLALDIGGTGPGSTHDLVNISGDAQIDGLLKLSLVDGFTPNASDEFTLFAAASFFGFFDNVGTGERLDTTDGRGSFVVNYGIGSALDENRIILSDFEAIVFLEGDYDGDEFVGQADLDLVLLHWGEDTTSTGVPDGWINQQPTGLIGQAALDVVLLNWGDQLEAITAATTAVPEPATSGLFAVALLGLASAPRRCIASRLVR